MADIKVGDKAPDFSLPITLEKKMALSDILKEKKVVLAFYLFDFAGDWEGLWTAEWARFRDRAAEIRGLKAEVVGISTDGPFCHKAFAEKLGLDFPLLSDYNKQVIPQYGVQYEELAGFKGLAKRSVIIIDQDGTVKYKWVTDEPATLPNLDEVIAAI
jgi:peroxiredoxin